MNKLILLTICWMMLAASITFACADTINPNIKGVIVICSGRSAGAYPFASITGSSSGGGSFTDAQGKQTQFPGNNASKRVYFDNGPSDLNLN